MNLIKEWKCKQFVRQNDDITPEWRKLNSKTFDKCILEQIQVCNSKFIN